MGLSQTFVVFFICFYLLKTLKFIEQYYLKLSLRNWKGLLPAVQRPFTLHSDLTDSKVKGR